MADEIVITGARQNNLKNIDVRIPRNSLTVITGLSGSGKSREPLGLRAPVPGPVAKARRGAHRGPVAGHLH